VFVSPWQRVRENKADRGGRDEEEGSGNRGDGDVALPASINGLWKADLIIGRTDQDRWVAVMGFGHFRQRTFITYQ
jgi:hypothetical protein